MIRLLDVSVVQRGIDWQAVAAIPDIKGVYVECIIGNDGPNPVFAAQVAGARAVGLAVGAYAFVYPLPNAAGHVNRDPMGQATLFKNAAQGVGSQQGDLPPVIDAEYPAPQDWAKWGCTADSIAEWLDDCATNVDAGFGRQAMIYTYPYWWKALGSSGLDIFGDRPLWFADYPDAWSTTPPTDGTTFPVAPAPWTSVTMWQHSDKLPCPGGGLVDGSVFNGDDAAWQAFLTPT